MLANLRKNGLKPHDGSQQSQYGNGKYNCDLEGMLQERAINFNVQSSAEESKLNSHMPELLKRPPEKTANPRKGCEMMK